MTITDFISNNIKMVSGAVKDDDARFIIEILICDILDLPFSFGSLNGSIIIEETDLALLNDGILKICQGMPVQYVTGISWFMGLKIKVNKNVLIPRPETEELVELILENCSGLKSQKVVDIGSGSGCIAISLAKYLKDSTVKGIEISQEAIELATENALINGVNVNFINCDILKADPPENQGIDLIVSNPPYIEPDESNLIDKNVLEYEPELALFTPEGIPMIFYEKIMSYGLKYLNPGGTIYFEINPEYSSQLEELSNHIGFEHIVIKNDLSGKQRFLMISR